MSCVELYYDFSCPWSYLALVRLQDVCERNRARLTFRPVSVGKVLATENPERVSDRFSANPARASWERRDLDDWAQFWGLQIDLADDWPRDRADVAAAALVAIEEGAGMSFSRSVFRAEFAGNEDISQPAVLGRIAAECGLDPQAVIAAATDPQRRAQIETNSLELIERGGFGTPSMFVDDTLFFGNDRVSLVEWTLGPFGDEDFVVPGQHNG